MFTNHRLARALAQIGAGPSPRLFDQLERLYAEPSRHYHTATHVEECLKALDQHASLAERPAEVELAIWFHDAIYDSRRSDNEEQSAALARSTLSSLSLSSSSVDRITSMILATKSHHAEDRDTQLLLDIDLGILGQPPIVFARYDEAIRKEYGWVPWEQYQAGRTAILATFLERPRIYVTDTFRDLFEHQARKNIEARLRELDD